MKPVLVLLGIALLFVIACGCTQSTQPATPAVSTTVPILTTEPSRTVVTDTPVLPKTPMVSDNTVSIRRTFDPVNITVNAGATVRWVNTDSTEDPALYNPSHRLEFADKTTSPVLSPSQSWSLIFRTPGVYEYSDMVHQTMHGTVIVK
jgi:plastocyanin